MGNNDFSIPITTKISAPQAIKKIGNVPEWWGVTYTGRSEKLNDQFTIRMGGDSFFNFTVTELLPGKRIVWLITDCHMPWYSDKKEWEDTRLIFDLREQNGVTEIMFTHEGLTPGVECYNDCASGWTHWIQTSLLSYLNTGVVVFRAPTK